MLLVGFEKQSVSVESRGPTFGRQSLHSWLSFGEVSASVRPRMCDLFLTFSNRTLLSLFCSKPFLLDRETFNGSHEH